MKNTVNNVFHTLNLNEGRYIVMVYLTNFMAGLPMASILKTIQNLGKSANSWENAISDIIMAFLFLIGVIMIFKGFMDVRKSQPSGMHFGVGFAALVVSGIFFKNYLKVQNAVNSVTGDAAHSALNGNG